MTIDGLNSAIYEALVGSELELTGGIYFDNERPLDSTKEDIAINTPALNGGSGTHQTGYTNINIYVPKLRIKIGGTQRMVRNRIREKQLVELVTEVVKTMSVKGVASVESESKEQSMDGSESFVCVRVYWNIYYV